MYCPNCGSSEIERHGVRMDCCCSVGSFCLEVPISCPIGKEGSISYSCNSCWSWFDAPVETYQLTMPLDGDQLTLEVVE